MNTTVKIKNLKLKNPVTVASGTYAFGKEYQSFIDIEKLGGISVKGITPEPKNGNPPPRIHESNMGILNSIGLQNPGIEGFIKNEMPFLKEKNTAIIVNISANKAEEYGQMASRLEGIKGIDAIEVNVSCPNVKKEGEMFGTNPESTFQVTKKVKEETSLPVIVKLTPNVTDIATMAKTAEEAGADSISLVNTFLAMAIDLQKKKPVFNNIFAGYSGPAIKPIALRMVWEVYKAVKVPIIGMGGIMNTEDALEFIMAGATAIALGTTNFINPKASIEVIDGIKDYMKNKGIEDVNELIGLAHIK